MFEIIKKPMNIIAIGAGVAVLGGIITAYGTYLQNKSSSERNSRIETGVNTGVEIGRSTNSEVIFVKQQNESLKGKIEKQDTTIDALRQENNDLHGKLQQASRTIFDYVKGSEKFVYIDVVNVTKGDYRFLLRNDNDLPVYGFGCHIIDYDAVLDCKSEKDGEKLYYDYDCVNRCGVMFNEPEVGVGDNIYSNEFFNFKSVSSKNYGRYQIRFKFRGKAFYQQLVYQKIGSTVYTAWRMFESKAKSVKAEPGEDPIIYVVPDRSGLDLEIVSVKPPNYTGWNIDFDKEFPSGIVNYTRPLK